MADITFNSNIPNVMNTIMQSMKQGAKDSMQKVLDASQMIVPLDETPLQKSGKLTEDGNTIIVSYGTGEAAKYAVIQHENLQYRHAPGRQAKYLEQPFRTLQPTIIQSIGDAIKAQI